jgi:hypothetical protein
MKSEKILTAIGKLDDRLIADAAIPKTKKRRTPFWIGLAAAAACLCLLLSAFIPQAPQTKVPKQYDNSLYSITVEDGQHKIFFKEDPPELNIPSNMGVSIRLIFPKFESIGQMRQAIITGSFAETELIALTFGKDAAAGVEICDPDQLYEATTPEGFTLNHIALHGTDYYFDFSSETVQAEIHCYNQADYQEDFYYGYKDFLTNSNITITNKQVTLDRLATVYYGHTDVAKFKFICYELRSGNKKMYIQEEYLLESERAPEAVSSKIPDTISIWGEENGGYFHGYLTDFTQRPSVKWLRQFEVQPYTDN